MSDANNTTLDTADVLAIDSAITRDTGTGEFGITAEGFVPKPFARLLAEKLALARELLGQDVDLGSGSVVRKLCEITALEETRTWAALGSGFDDCFVVSAGGVALSRLGEELGLPRPFMPARGKIKIKLIGDLPAGTTSLEIPRGARLLTPGGHHVATEERLELSAQAPERDVTVAAFYPGPEHNLDPTTPDGAGDFPQKIDRWNPLDARLTPLFLAEQAAGAPLTEITHETALTGGGARWSDARYRALLLSAPRSIWTVAAMETAASLVPGVRQVKVSDGWGGLDISQSIFGNFNFIERVFSGERDLGSPYYFTVLVAPTTAALWEGPDGLRATVESAIEDLRPISIFPRVEQATQIGVGIECKLVVKGLPLPTGSRATVNASAAARELKQRLMLRVQRYVAGLGFGEPVRASEVMWSLMNEPGIADTQDLKLVRYPPGFDAVDFSGGGALPTRTVLGCGENVTLTVNQVPEFVNIADGIEII
ncbi:MAG: hypothetical protein JJT90_12260 [Ectothiorhodospiraceae bacterium]|nr:hypothetical protein [Ectothiorhodospiraceae bacterium]